MNKAPTKVDQRTKECQSKLSKVTERITASGKASTDDHEKENIGNVN